MRVVVEEEEGEKKERQTNKSSNVKRKYTIAKHTHTLKKRNFCPHKSVIVVVVVVVVVGCS